MLTGRCGLRSRRVKIQDLCHETGMERADVLHWLKAHANSSAAAAQQARAPNLHQQAVQSQSRPPATSSTGASSWSGSASIGSPAPPLVEFAARTEAKADAGEDRQASTDAGSRARPFHERQRQGSDFERKRLSKAVEGTLEKVYERSTWPSEAMLRSIYDLHHLPRRRILEWFEWRREQEK
ncbi:hypothetical protein WJX72_010330 [[Myrmecia] bisecta]|uniref:Homeobox domain-containing protein n=1 Tax=[Myrmecia] bisecta TaxID=41462 RepID=A0AAW1QBA5_9CHLO